MSQPPAVNGPSGADELAALAGRLAERLRRLPLARLQRPVGAHASRARAGLAAAQVLAELAQGVEGRAEEAPTRWRQVPWLGEAPVGDQVAVTAGDAARSLRGVEARDQVWTRSGRRPAGEVVRETLRQLRTLKQSVDEGTPGLS